MSKVFEVCTTIKARSRKLEQSQAWLKRLACLMFVWRDGSFLDKFDGPGIAMQRSLCCLETSAVN